MSSSTRTMLRSFSKCRYPVGGRDISRHSYLMHLNKQAPSRRRARRVRGICVPTSHPHTAAVTSSAKSQFALSLFQLAVAGLLGRGCHLALGIVSVVLHSRSTGATFLVLEILCEVPVLMALVFLVRVETCITASTYVVRG